MALMKKHRLFRRFFTILLTVLLLVSLPLPFLPYGKAEAIGSTKNMTNLVIFVRYGNDTRDIFNATSGSASNWKKIKQMYENGDGYGDDSFKKYISVVTEGGINVTNYFPQEKPGKDGVNTCELAINSGDKDILVREVINAFSRGGFQIDTASYKLDNLQNKVIDNLTIIVQGDTDNEKNSAYHATYSGEGTIGGLRVYDYNVIPSGWLVAENPTDIYLRQEQGVIAHEFLHTLGLPDLYRYNGIGEPVGDWDIMASVSPLLQYPLSYLRARQGWITMGNITQSGTYTLTAASATGGTKVFALRTPLSDSEFICLEYRKKESDPYNFEYRLPASGLLMYRVDNKVSNTVEGLSNSGGKNYIYVYRPGVTNPETGTDTAVGVGNLSRRAALSATEGASYGTTDLNADFTQNTLYYSDGSNSGIRISNLKLSSDEKQLTFTVTFANYSEAISWEKLGDSVGSQCMGDPVICTDPTTGTLYAAYAEDTGSTYANAQVCVKRWNGATWQQVGTKISQSWDAKLAFCGGELYLSCLKSGQPVYYKLENGTWKQIAQYNVSYPKYMQFIVDGSEIYGAYEADGRWVIYDLKSGKLVDNSLTAKDFSNPAILKSNGCFYMVYANSAGGGTVVKKYDFTNRSWSTVHTLSSQYTNLHQIVKQGQKIYAFGGEGYSTGTAVLAVFDGSSWINYSVSALKKFNMASMDMAGNQVCLAYYDTDSNKASLLQGTGSCFQTVSDKLGTGLDHVSICCYGNTVYAATRARNTSNLVVRKMTVSGGIVTPTTSPVTEEKRTIILTPPAGYGDNHIYIDGVGYTAVRKGSNLELKLPDTSGKTAVMYSYDGKGVPVGMYVWKLSWTGEVCKATPMPGLQDLLSYHGFSIRVQNPAGIRFKSGIETGLKQRLIAGGVDGCKLTEYGTLFITNENMSKYPFVKDGTKVGGGRAYWTESGKVYDKVFETVAGRNRFTSVLINLAPNMYAKDIAFRAYAVLVCDGQEIIVYGPPVSRSVYTVAKQVQAKGEFKPGSSGYKYIQGIIDSVEKR